MAFVAQRTFESRFGACVEEVATTAMTRVSQQQARAKSMVGTVLPVTVTIPKAQSGLVALAMFHNPVPQGVDAFCDAVSKAIEARLYARGRKEQATVSFLERGGRTLLVSIGHEPNPAMRGVAVAMQAPPAKPAPVMTTDEGRVEAINLLGIVDRLRPHLRAIAACVTAVEQQFPPEHMEEELGITRERLRAFNHGELFLAPAEARTLLRNVANAALHQDYPVIARGTCGAEIQALLDATENKAIFSR